MNTLLKFLYFIQIFEITPNRVEHWVSNQNVGMLCFTLTNGLQKERIRAMEGLRQILGADALPLILPHLKDELKAVAQEARKIVTQTDKMGKYSKEIESAKKYWVEKEKLLAAMEAIRDEMSHSLPPSKLIDKSKMKQFNQLKERLKKPIR